jgi:fucose 4-O-acetylase-like acetyltransferase
MNMTISFNTKGYDGYIDFIKAFAILCVILGHSLLPLEKIGYSLWAGMQVPLFILVQTFHCYKKDSHKLNIGKILSRVMFPFLTLEVIVFFVALLFGFYDCKTLIIKVLNGGGMATDLIILGFTCKSHYFYRYLHIF